MITNFKYLLVLLLVDKYILITALQRLLTGGFPYQYFVRIIFHVSHHSRII
jgi:hypothetical protein